MQLYTHCIYAVALLLPLAFRGPAISASDIFPIVFFLPTLLGGGVLSLVADLSSEGPSGTGDTAAGTAAGGPPPTAGGAVATSSAATVAPPPASPAVWLGESLEVDTSAAAVAVGTAACSLAVSYIACMPDSTEAKLRI